MEDIDKREAELLARLEAEREQRLADKIAAGEIVSVPLFIVAGSETEARAQVEQAKAAKLKELHDVGDRREVVFAVTMVVTGVVQHGEARDPERAPTAPAFSRDDAAAPRVGPRDFAPLPAASAGAAADTGVEQDEPQPPLIETPICVQVGRCRDDLDPGTVVEGYFSVDGSTVTVTNKSGGHVGSRVMLAGEDARVVAKRLLRDKQAPESESSFSRPLSYPRNAGLA
jgi:hypothetical protein